MEKISEIKSKEYEKGRVDYFLIENQKDLHSEIISLLSDLGFSDTSIEDLDFDFEIEGGHHFAYCDNMRFHLFIMNDSISFLLDTNKSKQKIISIVKRYFKIF